MKVITQRIDEIQSDFNQEYDELLQFQMDCLNGKQDMYRLVAYQMNMIDGWKARIKTVLENYKEIAELIPEQESGSPSTLGDEA